MANRKEVEAYILDYFSKISPRNAEKYKAKFKAMNDKAFDNWMQDLRSGEAVLDLEVPNMVEKIDVDTLIATSKKLGIDLFTRLKLWDEPTQSYYTTTKKYIMLKLPMRRMAQFLDHKLAVPESDGKIDHLSGQVMKPDQANSIAQVEVQALYARGLNATIMELIKYRGGDISAFADYKRSLEELGMCTIGDDTNSITRSVVVLDVFFSGMQLESNAAGI